MQDFKISLLFINELVISLQNCVIRHKQTLMAKWYSGITKQHLDNKVPLNKLTLHISQIFSSVEMVKMVNLWFDKLLFCA